MAPRATPHLSTALAQRIVDELETSLETNLNLMDAGGIIIASRDSGRVGSLHPGAREAAENDVAVTVLAGAERPGERPGVNLPLKHRGRVIGVVGVTGDPESVRHVTSVLVLTIGMLIEREFELVGETHRDARDRDLLARLGFTHRNTVMRRLESVSRRSGHDPRVPAGSSVLALALAVARERDITVHNALPFA